MFLVKRDNSNKNYIIKGFITAILLSAFIYLSYFDIQYKLLNTILGILAIYALLVIPRTSLFLAGFLTANLWFYWMAISLQYYDLSYLAPVLLFAIGLGYGIIFTILGIFKSTFIRLLMIFGFTFVAPFGFNWMKFELLFIDSYFGVSKEDFALILVAVYMMVKLKRMKILSFLPLLVAYQSDTGLYIDDPKASMAIPQFNVSQDLKWKKKYKDTLIEKNLEEIDKAILDKKDLLILPETTLPIVLNRNELLLEHLTERSNKIDILVGSLYFENQRVYNATYHFSKGELNIAKKVVLVPFGEEIPLPKFFVDLINDTFYGGAQDYAKAQKPTDFIIKGQKFRNAICYEATTDKIFENLNGVKYMIATSNNAWFTPSIEPTLQKLLLKYYAKKYDVTIFHSINGSENYTIRP